MLDAQAFRALCIKVADEEDPKKLELLKERMRILLQEWPEPPHASTSSSTND